MDTPQGKVPEVHHVSNQSVPLDTPEGPETPQRGPQGSLEEESEDPPQGTWGLDCTNLEGSICPPVRTSLLAA